MISTAFAHGIAVVDLTRHREYLKIDLLQPGSVIRSSNLTVFGDSLARTRPALLVDGADPFEALEAMRQALALLDEALEGSPSQVSHAVYQARDTLARGLTVPTEG